MGDRLRTMLNIEIIKTDLENELLYLKGSIPGSKNTEVVVRQSVKNINKMTISEKIAAAEEAKLIVSKAKEDATALIARRTKTAEEKIAAAERAAIADVRAQAAAAATAAAAALIAKGHDGKADKSLVDETISTLN